MARKKGSKVKRAHTCGKKRKAQKGGLAPLAVAAKVAAPHIWKGLKKLFRKRRR